MPKRLLEDKSSTKGKKKKTAKSYFSTPLRLQDLHKTAFPKTTIVKLRYVEQFSLDAGIGTMQHWYFRTTSPFDPSYTGAGHQPLGFDEWSTFYKHYVVISSKCTLTGSTSSNTHAAPQILGIQVLKAPGAPTTPEWYLEQGATQRKYFNHTSYGGINPKTVSCTFSTKKFFNVTNISDNIDRLGAATNANPTENAYFACSTGNIDVTADSAAVSCIAEIEYLVLFSDPQTLGSS